MKNQYISFFSLALFAFLQISGQANAADCYEENIFQNGKNKLKTIHVDLAVSQESSGKIINVDASKSTTPSGTVQYDWTSPIFNHHDSNNPKNTINPSTPNTYRQAQFGITDPVCKLNSKTQVNINSK